MPTTLPDDGEIQNAQQAIGVQFKDPGLLRVALTHQSFINENPETGVESNERLEFLGDGALNFIVARRFYALLPGVREGGLTARRAQAVRRETLAAAAKRIGLGDLLVMGKGEEASGGAGRASNLADCFEAVTGAVLLDRGMRQATSFVRRWLSEDLKRIAESATPKDPKSRLQEMLQGRGKPAPKYRLLGSEGPGNDPSFTVEVLVDGHPLATGTGRRKVDAERAAAREAGTMLEKAARAE